MHFTYTIQSKQDKSWYYGYSSDPYSRLEFDNQGKSTYTQSKIPWELIFLRKFDNKTEALKFERYLKKTRNKKYILTKFAGYFIRGVAQSG